MTRQAALRRERSARGAARPRRGAGTTGDRRWFLAVLALALVALAIVLYLTRGGGAVQGDQPLAVFQTADFHALAFSPTDPKVALFGHHNGIMRTEDGGKTWRPLVDRRNFDAMGLAVSGVDPSRLYLAGHDIFQVSNDGGTSWQPVSHNLPGTDIHGFAMIPGDPVGLYAFVVGRGAFRSGDGGSTWDLLPGQLPGDVMGLAAGSKPQLLYATSMSSGLLRSLDEGATWEPFGGIASRLGLAVAVDPVSSMTVYGGSEGGLYKSMDGGISWNRLPFPGENAVAVAVNPIERDVLLAISVKDRRGLLFRSDDGGLTWGGRR